MAPKPNQCYSGLGKCVRRDITFRQIIQYDFEREVEEETWEEELNNLRENRRAMRYIKFYRMLKKDQEVEEEIW